MNAINRIQREMPYRLYGQSLFMIPNMSCPAFLISYGIAPQGCHNNDLCTKLCSDNRTDFQTADSMVWYSRLYYLNETDQFNLLINYGMT